MSLHDVVKRENVEGLRTLLATGAFDTEITNGDGKVPLLVAVSSGNVEIVRLLMENGATIRATDSNGRTPLHVGIMKRSVDIVHILLENGADVNAATKHGDRPLHVGVRTVNMHVMRLLLQHGADIHGTTAAGHTPLHAAARWGNVKIVQLLLEHGANIHGTTTDQEGDTPLHTAARWGNVNIARFLLENGASIHATTMSGETPLHIGARGGHVNVVRLLLERRANIEAKDILGRSALWHAASRGKADVVRHLAENGAMIDEVDQESRSPLAASIWTLDSFVTPSVDKYHVAKTLCDLGAKWDAACARGAQEDSTETQSPEEVHGRQIRSGLRACVRHWSQQRGQDHASGLTDIPEEIYSQGARHVASYVASLATTSKREMTRRRKVCVVGPSCSGKTSLVQSLNAMECVMVDDDNRTIGIDLFTLKFTDTAKASNDSHDDFKYEASIWDFAGQDIYQVAHSLYYSKRTLYLVFVNLEAYTQQLELVSIGSINDAEKGFRRWVQDNVFRWIRLILARQPDAELVLVCSKADTVSLATAEEVVSDLRARLAAWAASFVLEKDGPTRHAVQRSMSELQDRQVLHVSVASQEAVKKAMHDVQRIVAEKRERAFVMPLQYTQVLEAIDSFRTAASSIDGVAARVRSLLVPAGELINRLVHQIDGLRSQECRHILTTLHYLGDILWYQQEHRLSTTGMDAVVLDPRVMLDLVREVVNHTLEDRGGVECEALRLRGELSHSLLMSCELWGALGRQSHALVLYFKRLLQRFNLAYPVGNHAMMWDSDLVVPAYWKSKKQSTSAQDDDRNDDHGAESTATTVSFDHNVTWQYTVPTEVSETIFDQFIVQCYSVEYEQAVSATVVEIFNPRECLAQIRYKEGRRKQSDDVIVIHVAATSSTKCWATMNMLVMAMERVLAGYPGLGTVQRHLLQRKLSGKDDPVDLKRVMASDGGRLNASTFAKVQARFCTPSFA